VLECARKLTNKSHEKQSIKIASGKIIINIDF
jgi:hypothetical protein